MAGFRAIGIERGKGRDNPYLLGNGRHLQLVQLLDILMEDASTEIAGKPGGKAFNFTIVAGSGRHTQCSRQIGLVSDMLGIPETAALLGRECHKRNIDCNITSCLDIDVLDDLERGRSERIAKSNILAVGSGYVNALTASIVSHYQKGEELRPGFVVPYSSEILGYSNVRYAFVTHPNSGTLILCRSPWHATRVAIVSAGICAIGTLGANALLHCYLQGSGTRYGNNKNNDSVPSKIIDVRFKSYKLELTPTEMLYPIHDVRNLKDSQYLLDSITVLE